MLRRIQAWDSWIPRLQSRSGYRGVRNGTTYGDELRHMDGGTATRTADESLPINDASSTQEPGVLADRYSDNSAAPKDTEPHWIKGVYICATISMAVLLVNVILISIAGGLAEKHPQNRGFSVTQVLYEGSCTLTKRWNTALHLIINVLSTTIIGASNYCMQSLVAPNREEVDKSHAQKRWLDIGVPSVRNFSAVGRYRTILWFILLVTATPFHLLYNSATFQTIAKSGFAVVLAPSDLDPRETADLTTSGLENCFEGIAGYSWHDFVSYLANGTYTRHNKNECISLSNQVSPSTIQTMVVLTDSLKTSNGGDLAILQSNMDVTPSNIARPEGIDPNLLKGSMFSARSWSLTINDKVTLDASNYTSLDCWESDIDPRACSNASSAFRWVYAGNMQSVQDIDDVLRAFQISGVTPHVETEECLTDGWYFRHIAMGDCLVIPTEGRCRFMYNPPIGIVVIITAAIKVAAMVLAAKLDRYRSAPLLTVGDAVASFLTRPDTTTAGMCWISKSDVNSNAWRKLHTRIQEPTFEYIHSENSRQPDWQARRLPRPGLWWQTASILRWGTTLALCGMCIGLGAYLLDQAAGEQTLTGNNDSSVQHWWKLGFGTADGSQVIQKMMHWPILGYVIVANAPQFIVTIAYYFYNNVLTSMLAAVEYSSYATSRKPLRVSWPKQGTSQRSTYWLSIPYWYNAPLLITFVALHWTISQSLFYVQILPYDLYSQPIPGQFLSALGYSPMAIFVSLLLGALIISGLLVVASCRRSKSLIPLAGCCSAAISAACHPGVDEDTQTAAFKSVMWGETVSMPDWMVVNSGDTGHCSFTSKEVETPSREKMYA